MFRAFLHLDSLRLLICDKEYFSEYKSVENHFVAIDQNFSNNAVK